mmetsp:Transcript_31344/g.103398  ORF Transcript_31344/g.103398 Transcript_31344/m.103398 type:complete len:205 (+) Transcript_31344:218-832(+)
MRCREAISRPRCSASLRRGARWRARRRCPPQRCVRLACLATTAAAAAVVAGAAAAAARPTSPSRPGCRLPQSHRRSPPSTRQTPSPSSSSTACAVCSPRPPTSRRCAGKAPDSEGTAPPPTLLLPAVATTRAGRWATSDPEARSSQVACRVPATRSRRCEVRPTACSPFATAGCTSASLRRSSGLRASAWASCRSCASRRSSAC